MLIVIVTFKNSYPSQFVSDFIQIVNNMRFLPSDFLLFFLACIAMKVGFSFKESELYTLTRSYFEGGMNPKMPIKYNDKYSMLYSTLFLSYSTESQSLAESYQMISFYEIYYYLEYDYFKDIICTDKTLMSTWRQAYEARCQRGYKIHCKKKSQHFCSLASHVHVNKRVDICAKGASPIAKISVYSVYLYTQMHYHSNVSNMV